MGGARRRASPSGAGQSLAAQIERLSEEGGDFDTDNLISNERSFLEVIPALKAAGVSGGAYIGVGPDQNFSYIAQLRPSIAFIIDIRRDNLLLHLLFKSLFGLSRNRVEYLALLTGRTAPDRLDSWRAASLERVVGYIDGAKPEGSDAPATARPPRARCDRGVRRAVVRGRLRHDPALPSHVHHQRPGAEVRKPRPPAPGGLSHLPRPDPGDRSRRHGRGASWPPSPIFSS